MTIEEKIFFYKNNLDCFEETMDKYRFLLDQGKKAVSFPIIVKERGLTAKVYGKRPAYGD